MRTRLETPFGTMFQPWPIRPLSEVAFFQEGPGLRKWQWTEAGMKVINVTNILGDGSVDVNNTARFIASEEFERKYTHFAVEAGDIVVASSGNTYGKVGRITHAHLPLMMNTSVIRFHSSNPCTLDQGYLYAFLRSPLFRNQVESYVIGSAQPNFGPSHLKRMVIPCPEITVQRKIASILSTYDDLIENNTRRIAILEEMAQSLYREWFVEFRFPGHEKARFIDSPVGKIPEGWKAANLFEVADVAYGFPYKSKLFSTDSDGDPVIRIRDILHHKSETYTTEDAGDKFNVMNGDILVGMDGDFHMCRWAGGHAVLNQRVARLRTLGELHQYVVFHAAKSPIEHFNATIVGTTVAHLGDKHLREITVAVPSADVGHHAHLQFGPLFDEEINLRRRTELLRSTRDLLLPKLMSGQVDVEDLDIDIGESLAEADA